MKISKYYRKYDIYAISEGYYYFWEGNDDKFYNFFKSGLISYDYIQNNFDILDDTMILFENKKEAQRFLDYLESILVLEKLTEE